MPKTVPTNVVHAALLGFTGAATVPPVSGLIGRRFGAANVAALYGLVFFVHQTGGYTAIWTVDIVLSLFAAAVSFSISEKQPVLREN